jgi:hypothetical protein
MIQPVEISEVMDCMDYDTTRDKSTDWEHYRWQDEADSNLGWRFKKNCLEKQWDEEHVLQDVSM